MGQHLEQPNVELPICRDLEISNIKKQKMRCDFLFSNSFFIFRFLFELFKYSKYMIIHRIGNLWNFDSFTNCEILEIFGIFKVGNFLSFPNSKFF